MLLFRWFVFMLLLAALVSFAFFGLTGQPRFKQWGLRALRWAVYAGLFFFGVLILERVARMV